ncbi:hypothetical protein PT974_12109 [Cladobotryum mycophilum]|uniref:Uncharacterized protein n=1 Tax=Cladobotryum mycophilum TaxID=491253 RepID=A0ABR0S778_9HYPO
MSGYRGRSTSRYGGYDDESPYLYERDSDSRGRSTSRYGDYSHDSPYRYERDSDSRGRSTSRYGNYTYDSPYRYERERDYGRSLSTPRYRVEGWGRTPERAASSTRYVDWDDWDNREDGDDWGNRPYSDQFSSLMDSYDYDRDSRGGGRAFSSSWRLGSGVYNPRSSPYRSSYGSGGREGGTRYSTSSREIPIVLDAPSEPAWRRWASGEAGRESRPESTRADNLRMTIQSGWSAQASREESKRSRSSWTESVVLHDDVEKTMIECLPGWQSF